MGGEIPAVVIVVTQYQRDPVSFGRIPLKFGVLVGAVFASRHVSNSVADFVQQAFDGAFVHRYIAIVESEEDRPVHGPWHFRGGGLLVVGPTNLRNWPESDHAVASQIVRRCQPRQAETQLSCDAPGMINPSWREFSAAGADKHGCDTEILLQIFDRPLHVKLLRHRGYLPLSDAIAELVVPSQRSDAVQRRVPEWSRRRVEIGQHVGPAVTLYFEDTFTLSRIETSFRG